MRWPLTSYGMNVSRARAKLRHQAFVLPAHGDFPAAALMNHFYCRLLEGDSAADALRYAQLQLLHCEYPEPRQWAAFTPHGDPEGRWK